MASTIIDFNDLEERVTTLEANSGGEITLPDNIQCKSIEVTGNNINWTTNTGSNLNLGAEAAISAYYFNGNVLLGELSEMWRGEMQGNAIFGYMSEISGGYQHGNIILGINAKIIGGTQNSNIIIGTNSTISEGAQNGNILGGHTNISGGHQEGNVILSSASISGGEQYGNLILGSASLYKDCTTTRNTWIIGSLGSATNFESQITKRYGLTLIGTPTYHDPSASNSYRYQVYWPDSGDYPAQIHGWTQYTNDYNVKDAEGNLIIENGKSTALKLVTVDSESELPPESEREDNVLYAVTEPQSASILRIAPKNQLNEIDVLNARINALEKYIERTFVKNVIEEADVIDGGELDVIDNKPATL